MTKEKYKAAQELIAQINECEFWLDVLHHDRIYTKKKMRHKRGKKTLIAQRYYSGEEIDLPMYMRYACFDAVNQELKKLQEQLQKI